MSLCHSTEARSSIRSNAVSRLFGGLRGWIGEEIDAIRAAELDNAFFATTKGMQYRPTRHGGALGESPAAS